MVGAEIIAGDFIRQMTDIERRQLPRITLLALNDAAAEVRGEWRKTLPSVFDRPTPLTLNAPLFTKATPSNLVAEVFIRDKARGVPPSVYLRPEVFGGPRNRKASEIALRRNTIFPAYWVPADAAPRDAFGNVSGTFIRKVIRQVRATKGAGRKTQRESEATRARRFKRQRRRGGGGSYFVLRDRHGSLKPGIVYERIESGFGTAIRPILIGVIRAPRYKTKFDAFGLAQSIFARRFAANFRAQLTRVTGGRL